MEAGITLFDDKKRVDQRLPRHKEPLSDYLNDSARSPVVSIRELLEAWFQRYPTPAKQELRGRFRSEKASAHLGAFFELYLHALLCSLGFEAQVHPDLSANRKTHPDFLVLKDGRPCFYLEATLAHPSEEDMAEKARIDQVYDTLNKMQSPHFFLAIRLYGVSTPSPSAKRLRQKLAQWLAALDPDEIGHQLALQSFYNLPSFPWSHDGWDLEFIPIPKPAAMRGSPGLRPIGITLPEMTRIAHPSIGKAVRAKAAKYGKLALPFIVGVDVIDIFMRNVNLLRYQVINELFGEEIPIGTLRPDGTIDGRRTRKPNGAWFGPHGPQNKRVSAVLIVVGLDPWTIANRTPVMIHNPWATCPFPLDQWPLPQWVPNLHDDYIHERLGKSAAEVLSLPDAWPPMDDA